MRFVCAVVYSKVNVTEDNKEKKYSEKKVTGEFAFFGGMSTKIF